jgi:hypothetical protein
MDSFPVLLPPPPSPSELEYPEALRFLLQAVGHHVPHNAIFVPRLGLAFISGGSPPLPFTGIGPESRIIFIARHLPRLSSLVLRPLQMSKVRVYHPSSTRAHRVERTVRWNQGTQGAFKRVMTVRVKALSKLV